ncbi:hypothetical protein I4U23_014489 [Adineta vaga]|nr:hypothetical protein I4U23_014489 [Adineta vaga]
MTLITQANFIDKLNHQYNSKIQDNLKTLSFNVYSSRHLSSTSKSTKYHRSDLPILPSITKDEYQYQRKTKRPTYRTSVYHSLVSNVTPVDLPVINSHRPKPKLFTILRDESFTHFRRRPDPPPTPSDDFLDHASAETNRTRQTSPQLYTTDDDYDNDDGFIPYRLPALHQSTKQMRTEKYLTRQHPKTVLSDYYQTLYSKY